MKQEALLLWALTLAVMAWILLVTAGMFPRAY